MLNLNKNELALIKDIIATHEFERMRDVSFLGALDYIALNHQSLKYKKYSRADHAVGVLNIAAELINIGDFNEDERLTIIATSLCHDLGHSPFSHSLEKAFRKIDPSLCHKTILKKMLLCGNFEITNILQKYGIDERRVISLSNNNDNDPLNYIFHGSFNIDTLDGISRFLQSFSFPIFFSINNILRGSYLLNYEINGYFLDHKSDFDNFWLSKAFFYDHFLKCSEVENTELGFIERVSRQYKGVGFDDYMKTDSEFRSTLSYSDNLSEYLENGLDFHNSKGHEFSICPDVYVEDMCSISNRYLRSRKIEDRRIG